MFFIFIGHN